MKKIILTFILALLGTQLFADEATSVVIKNANNPHWFVQVDGTMGFATQNLENVAPYGFGGEGDIGYSFGDGSSIAIESGYETYIVQNLPSNVAGNFNYVPLVLKLQSAMGNGMLKPYAFIGGGLAFNRKYGSYYGVSAGATETDFLAEAGLGLLFEMTPDTGFYVQGQADFDFTSNNFAPDQTTIFIPVSAGFKVGV